MNTPTTAREVIERTWNAPIERVWELWTTPAGLESWYGPKGFHARVEALELREGGAFDVTMTAADPQKVAWLTGQGRPISFLTRAVFTEVNPPRSLAFEPVFDADHAGPRMVLRHRLELEPIDEGTRMVLRIEAERAEWIQGAAGGWRGAFERMAQQLAG